MNGLFRAWTWKASPDGKDRELLRLEKLADETREKLKKLKEHGRQVRNHRLESLDALETRRMTLQEIFKRMEKELAEKDVDIYADILAEAFGERVIYAHRAIGMEALLCQFMHQMLAKQHQLKILRRTGKDLQKLYQTHKTQNREEFHSYEALAVHLETMRLTLEAQYDDIFAAQHSLLARFHHVEAGGTMTNYKIVKQPPPNKNGLNEKRKALPPTPPTTTTSTSSTLTTIPAKRYLGIDSPPVVPRATSGGGGDSDDDDKEFVNILLTDETPNSQSSPNRTWTGVSPTRNGTAAPQPSDFLYKQKPSESTTSQMTIPSSPKKRMNGTTSPVPLPTSPPTTTTESISSPQQISARNRRREIEQKRLAAGRGHGRSIGYDDPDMRKAREKLRALEASRTVNTTTNNGPSSTTVSSNNVNNTSDTRLTMNDRVSPGVAGRYTGRKDVKDSNFLASSQQRWNNSRGNGIGH